MNRSKFIISFIAFIFSQTSLAFDLSILKNDKEAETHAFTHRELRRAANRFGNLDEEKIKKLNAVFNDLETKKQLCELTLINRMTSEFNDTHGLFIILRNNNYIDDLFFQMMDDAADLSERLVSFQAWVPDSREVEQAESLLKKTAINLYDLKELYSFIKGYSLKNPGCTLAGWRRLSDDFSKMDDSPDRSRLFNVVSLAKGIITKEEFELLEFYRVDESFSFGITFSRYLEILRETKNRHQPKTPSTIDLEPNHFSSKLIKKRSGPTYRQSLYNRFSSTQIAMIANLLKKTFQRMDSTKAEVVFTHDGTNEAFEISPMGQYYLARNLLKKDLEELNRSSLFSGSFVTHEDVVTAALETGLINGKIVDSVLKIDDLWNPEVSQWDKISQFAMRVTGTATLFLPPPYNMISSTALVFLDGIIYRKHKRSRQSESLYDFF
jgi:hypothetical protein